MRSLTPTRLAVLLSASLVGCAAEKPAPAADQTISLPNPPSDRTYANQEEDAKALQACARRDMVSVAARVGGP